MKKIIVEIELDDRLDSRKLVIYHPDYIKDIAFTELHLTTDNGWLNKMIKLFENGKGFDGNIVKLSEDSNDKMIELLNQLKGCEE